MKKLFLLAPALVFVAFALPRVGSDEKAVHQAVLDYVEGVYDCKPERMERAVHEKLHKFGFAQRGEDKTYRELPMTYEELVHLCKDYNKDGRIPADAPKEIEILDLLDQTAAVKLTAFWGIDYMHLAKYDGQWKIVQVLWQTVPKSSAE